jgi:uncharacterized protein with FMN-binding domain
MKRALLIAGGTIGGLGAILTITPPNLSSTTSMAGGIPQANPTTAPSVSSTAQPTTQPTSKPTKKSGSKPSAQPTTTPTAAQPSGAADGTYTGDAVSMRYGIVQVKITVKNGKITDAQAVQAPTGSNDRYTQMAVPQLRQQTIAAQSADIQGVSGASFTSYGWYTSLVSAVAKAGL